MSNYFEDCIDCENRKPNCHSYCKLYKNAKKKYTEHKRDIDRKNFENNELYAVRSSSIDRVSRKGRRR